VLTTHRDPDGDGICAECALAEAIQQLGKRVDVINGEPAPGEYDFLAGSSSLQTYQAGRHDPLISKADVVVLLDAGSPDRTNGISRPLSEFGGVTVVIDHHPGSGWAQLELVDTKRCATAELVYELICELPVRVTPTIVEAVYAGIVADTQGFRTSNTNAQVHRIAAQMLDFGVSIDRVHDALFASWKAGRLRLLGSFLTGLHTAAGGRLVWGVITRTDLRRWRQTPAAVDGFVGRALMVDGAEIAVLVQEEADGMVRFSFRSRGDVAVNGLARSLGGGGHRRAAGTRVKGPLGPTVRRVLAEAQKALEERC